MTGYLMRYVKVSNEYYENIKQINGQKRKYLVKNIGRKQIFTLQVFNLSEYRYIESEVGNHPNFFKIQAEDTQPTRFPISSDSESSDHWFSDTKFLVFLVKEYHNNTLFDLIKQKGGKLSESEIRPLLVQLADGIQFLRSKDIFHGHLNPKNIVIKDNNQLVIDGIEMARSFIKEETKIPKNQYDSNVRPDYMAPEMYNSQQPWFQANADLWSIGAILYTMLTGEIFVKQKLPNDISDELTTLLEELLEKDPTKRITFEQFYIDASLTPKPKTEKPSKPLPSTENHASTNFISYYIIMITFVILNR